MTERGVLVHFQSDHREISFNQDMRYLRVNLLSIALSLLQMLWVANYSPVTKWMTASGTILAPYHTGFLIISFDSERKERMNYNLEPFATPGLESNRGNFNLQRGGLTAKRDLRLAKCRIKAKTMSGIPGSSCGESNVPPSQATAQATSDTGDIWYRTSNRSPITATRPRTSNV